MADGRFMTEELLLNSMPSLQTVMLGGWAVRLNGGLTYRANCVCPLYGDQNDISGRITLCEEIFRRHGMSAVFKVTPALQPGLAETLAQHGYETAKTVYVMEAELPEQIPEPAFSVECEKRPGEEWLSASAGMLGVPEGNLVSIYRGNMRSIVPAAVFAAVRLDGKIAGCGYGTSERGYVGAYGFHVLPEYRRRGVGTSLFRSVCSFGRREGVHTEYLIVHSRNRNALSLYEKLGFRRSYDYIFMKKPGADGIIDA